MSCKLKRHGGIRLWDIHTVYIYKCIHIACMIYIYTYCMCILYSWIYMYIYIYICMYIYICRVPCWWAFASPSSGTSRGAGSQFPWVLNLPHIDQTVGGTWPFVGKPRMWRASRASSLTAAQPREWFRFGKAFLGYPLMRFWNCSWMIQRCGYLRLRP